jgi:hypothetical protein
VRVTPAQDVSAPVSITTDLALGGRWTSLRSSGPVGEREWLWQNPTVSLAQRAGVRPGSGFVDAGGGEECLPSVVGSPERGHDHGDVWCRPWVGEPADACVRTREGLTLRRRLEPRDGTVRVDYEITGHPGSTFLHAAHLLVDVTERAVLEVPGAPDVVVQDRPVPGRRRRTRWPDGDGVRLDTLGATDGTALCAVVASDAVDLVDGRDRLSLLWGSDAGVPVSFVLWRNLGGWPAESPYRSIGIEAMVGAATEVAAAAPHELAAIGDDGTLRWWLEISASARSG